MIHTYDGIETMKPLTGSIYYKSIYNPSSQRELHSVTLEISYRIIVDGRKKETQLDDDGDTCPSSAMIPLRN